MLIQNLHYLWLLMLFLSQPPNDSNSFIATYDVKYALGLEQEVSLSYADGIAHYQDYSNREDIGDLRVAQFHFYFDHYDWFYDLSTKEVHEYRTFEDSTKVCSSWPDTIQKWEITNEKLEIMGYTCQKAIAESYRSDDKGLVSDRGNIIVAWYTTEIPVPIGPARYHGLPGLIVKLELIKKKSSDGNPNYTHARSYSLSSIDFKKYLEISLPEWESCIPVNKMEILNYTDIDNKKWKKTKKKEMKENASN